jgi:hypothetical protein
VATYERQPPTASTNRVCDPFTNCSAQQAFIQVAGDSSQDHSCAPLTACSLVEFEFDPATATSDRSCRPLAQPCTALCADGFDVLRSQSCDCPTTGCDLCTGQLLPAPLQRGPGVVAGLLGLLGGPGRRLVRPARSFTAFSEARRRSWRLRRRVPIERGRLWRPPGERGADLRRGGAGAGAEIPKMTENISYVCFLA